MNVSIFLVRAMLEAAERSGVARADLRARLPIDWQCLEQPDSRLELEHFAQVLSVAVEATGDEALGLHVAEVVPEGGLDLLAHLTAHAPTMREAIEMCSRYVPIMMDGLRIAARDQGTALVVRYGFPRTTPLADRVFADFVMGGLARLGRSFSGPSVLPRLASFEHARPSYHREYARIFGDQLRFDQSVTSMAFDHEVVDWPQMHQHQELYDLLRVEAQRRLDRLTTEVRPSTRLRHYLLAMPLSRVPEMSTAARDLGMSERSLRRQLAVDGTSYREVVRSALESSAGLMLRDPHRTIKDTAVALGFADVAAFYRAFKRWTGMTPGEYRRAPLAIDPHALGAHASRPDRATPI